MKTIRDLVAGATGFNADRGDQLIVESLPFESNNAEDPMSAPGASGKPDAQPSFVEMLQKNRTVLMIVVGGLVLVFVLVKMLMRFMPRKASKVAIEPVLDELAAAAERRQVADASAMHDSATLSADAQRMLAESHAETAERVRQLAQRDPAVSANVLRMWLHSQKAGSPS
jgi:flagellar M-ring protein FliF